MRDLTQVGPGIAERLDRLPLTIFHWALIAAIYAGLAFDHMDQVVLSFVIPVYREEWGISPAMAALNPATGLFMTFVGAFFWGMMADRIGRKKVLMITLTIFSVTMGINGFAWSFPQLVATCIVMGFGVGGAIPLAFSLLAEYTPAKYRGMTSVVVGILSLVGGYLIASGSALAFMEGFGWRSLFLVGLIPILLVPLIARIVPESPRFLMARGRWTEALDIVRRLEARARVPAPVPTFAQARSDWPFARPSGGEGEGGGGGGLALKGLGVLWGPRYRWRTLMLWVYAYTFGFFTFGFITWLPSVLKGTGLSAGEIHLYTTIMDLMAFPAAAVTAILFFWWSTKRTLVLYPAVAGAGMVLLAFLVAQGNLTPALLIGVGSLIFFFGATLLGIFGPYSAEVYPTEIRGTGSGWATGFSRFGAFTAIPLGGALLGSAIPLFAHQLVFGIPLFVAAVVMVALGVETRGRRLEEIAAA